MRVWKCKQVIDFGQSTTTMKEERNKALRWTNQISPSFQYLTEIHHEYIHTARDWDWDWDWDTNQMESVALCRNVQGGPRKLQGPGPIISYCVSPIQKK